MHVILSSRAVWAAAKDAEVIEKARTGSMMAKKPRVEMVICYRGDAEVLSPATYLGVVVLGAEGSSGAEEAGVVCSEVVVAGVET